MQSQQWRWSSAALLVSLSLCVGCRGDDGDDVANTQTGSTETGTDTDTDTGTTGDGDEAPFDYCEGLPPDPACYAAKRDPSSEAVATAMAIADRHMQQFPATEQAWFWTDSVFMFSLVELYRVTGEPRYRDHVQAWMDHHIDAGYTIETSDTCVPVAMAAALWAETGDPKYRGPHDDALVYFDAAGRSNVGGLSHFGTSPVAVTLWVDSLFMLGAVMTRWGELDDDQALLDDLALQSHVFTDALQSADGFYAHAWNWPLGDDSLYWGRGNGWVAASGYDYLRALVIREQSDPMTEAALASEVQAILASQDPSGLWPIILNHPDESYLETSTTALFAYGMARGFRYGLLEGELVLPAIDAAMLALDTKIVPDAEGLPVVTEISGPTGPGDLAKYLAVPLEDDLGYGVGAVILALIESSGLPT